MTATPAPPGAAALPLAASEGLQLRASPQLQSVPPQRPVSAASALARPAAQASIPAAASEPGFGNSPLWLLGAVAALASVGWLLERRRRRALETEKDSVLWADVQPAGTSIITQVNDSDADRGSAASVPPQAGAALPSTTSARREATLSDLHELQERLLRRLAGGDLPAAVLLLQQHIAEFRFTSPWVFLELREIYHQLARERDWELAREVFQARFDQRAPLWQAPSTAGALLAEDRVICDEIVPHWPFRQARVAMLRWVLGEPASAGQPFHPPVLALGVYRDLLFLDHLLDRVLIARPAPVDSLL